MERNEIIKNICYTELVYGRINRKLKMNLPRIEVEKFISEILETAPPENYMRSGKNYYVTSKDGCTRLTVNSNTFRIITADSLENKPTRRT